MNKKEYVERIAKVQKVCDFTDSCIECTVKDECKLLNSLRTEILKQSK